MYNFNTESSKIASVQYFTFISEARHEKFPSAIRADVQNPISPKAPD